MSAKNRIATAVLASAILLAMPAMAQDAVSPKLLAAYQLYAQAHAAAMSATDKRAYKVAIRELEKAQARLEKQCATIDAPSLAECLDQAIPAESRQPGDLDAIPPLSEAPAAEQPAAEPEQPAAEPEQPAAESETTEPSAEPPAEPVEPGMTDVPGDDVAPIFDSAKEQAPAAKPAKTAKPVKAKPAAPPPASDAEAQSGAEPVVVESPTREQGRIFEKNAPPPPTETPKGAKIVNKSDFGIVFQFNNQLVIHNRDDERMRFRESRHTLEQLSRGRTRETVYRQDGGRLVTVYNANGDVVQRSLIDASGNEHVLVYVPEQYQQQLLQWQDPGNDLPPLQLNIPVSDYILDASRSDLATVRDFLAQPPLEPVRRYYSVDEVERSARLRDTVRRLELSDLSFDSGSAALRPEQFGSLEIVAEAMLDLLQANPAETFLIEGHTDAVGPELANLELSNRRAETIAIVLTEYFGIPPENLAPQGYGERYLKIRTQLSEPRNRRVSFKRITPLVAPVFADAAG